MSQIALVGPATPLGAQIKPQLEAAGIRAEEIEFFSPMPGPGIGVGEHGVTDYDGAAEWVKSVMSENLQKARLVLLCEPLPEGVPVPPQAAVFDLQASLRGAPDVPLWHGEGFASPGLRRFAAPSVLMLTRLLPHFPGLTDARVTHLASATEYFPEGAEKLLDDARRLLSGADGFDAETSAVFNLRPAGAEAQTGFSGDFHALLPKHKPPAFNRLISGQFHCGLLLVELAGAVAPGDWPAGWKLGPFASAQSAAGLEGPLFTCESVAAGLRLQIAYDPFSAALFPALQNTLRELTADA
jgi:hypothetical protein